MNKIEEIEPEPELEKSSPAIPFHKTTKSAGTNIASEIIVEWRPFINYLKLGFEWKRSF